MRNRDYKNFSSGSIYHIYNRGNNKEKIFLEDKDYGSFLFRLGMSLGYEKKELDHALLSFPKSRVAFNTSKNLFLLHAFCLMPNHFHLLIEQLTDIPISNLMLRACTSYAMFFNKKYNRVGHIFQDQFKAVPIESDRQLRWLSSYIHMNPVKDALVDNPIDYKWSSFVDFMDSRQPELPLISRKVFPNIFGNKINFAKETQGLNAEGAPLYIEY